MSIRFSRGVVAILLAAFLVLMIVPANAADPTIGINVVLNRPATTAILTDLGRIGKVGDLYTEINGLRMIAKQSQLPLIQAKPYVLAANADAPRGLGPLAALPYTDFTTGMSTWDLDAINVTDGATASRTVAYDGAGVYVAVVDTGLVDLWPNFFPTERIATQYGISFQGGGALDAGNVSISTWKWQHDQNSHGTHVTSTILGYNFYGTKVNGVAPKATVIPVKVLNQNGRGWSSVIARGILYVAELKLGPLAGSPVVINMSLGGSGLDSLEKAAIDYAISKGVIVVASAGNNGNAGMGYPGAYAPVISVAASGWTGEWLDNDGDGSVSDWWYNDCPDPISASDFYITSFSSRQKAGQDLDVAAPGSWVLGPYIVKSGQVSYYYLGGTSMASPHVAGIAALIEQKNPSLNAAQVATILKSSAVPLAPGCRNVAQPSGAVTTFCWGTGNDPASSITATGAGLADAAGALALVP